MALIRVLVRINCSVLLTSYTHSAVDNILLKLTQVIAQCVHLPLISIPILIPRASFWYEILE